MGEAVRATVEASDRKVAFLASSSLSYRIKPNSVVDDYLFGDSNPLTEKTDLMVMEMWQQGDTREFLDRLPQYAKDCSDGGEFRTTPPCVRTAGLAKPHRRRRNTDRVLLQPEDRSVQCHLSGSLAFNFRQTPIRS